MYAGYEPRGPLKRLVMSAAKEIVRVEESALHSRNMSERAGVDGPTQTTNTPVVGAERRAAVRRRLPDERRRIDTSLLGGRARGAISRSVCTRTVCTRREVFIAMAKEEARQWIPDSWMLLQRRCPCSVCSMAVPLRVPVHEKVQPRHTVRAQRLGSRAIKDWLRKIANGLPIPLD